MRKEVENRVARALLDGGVRDGETIEITVRDGKLVIEPIGTASQAGGKP
jgi:ATP-dependent Clp protease ATP-binding subunit ClpB